MKNIKKFFLESEADNYYKRNKGKAPPNDALFNEIIRNVKRYKERKKIKILEIGCSDGERLSLIKQKYKCNCYGLEPSVLAIKNRIDKSIKIKMGTADKIDYPKNYFDIIVYGFCLYLVDIKDLVNVFIEADRITKKNGLIIVKDFYSKTSILNQYKHFKKFKVHKYDFSKIFTWNPNYKLIHKIVYPYEDYRFKKDRLSIHTIKKIIKNS
jgi:ubiquinone/menaquinone biosynthesis C-methylase UbiE